ncbi:hypothetical protein MLD38_020050 [Melastoma candidum]|uniref:Uncharacterized protein n=1 Tax=Melastoma candidum TaxID=119954 RepID=A0ACB9QB97_9MYRT|nr:hypothetical protein MLD38_020050 [Melastoma candidum]
MKPSFPVFLCHFTDYLHQRIPPNPRVNPFEIPLHHPLFGPGSGICPIIDDRPKAKLTEEAVGNKVKADGVPVSKVLRLSKLRANYKPFEAKRKLCDSYELFLVDTWVVHALPALLGKHFYKQKKMPIGVDLRHLGWKEQVERVSSNGMLFLGTGTCSVVKVARLSMSREEIVENVTAAIEGVAETVPRGWSNVRSLHLKSMDSVALPIYQTVPDVKLKIEGLRGEDEAEPRPKKEKNKEDGQEEIKKKKKGSMREVRYMDMELDAEEGDGDGQDDDTKDLTESDDEELNAVMKKRKQEKEIG